MRSLIRFLLLCLLPMAGWTQSSPQMCQGTWPNSRWTNCVGTHILPWGDVYVGEYRDGARSGEGIEYGRDGSVNRSGRWDFNTLARSYLIQTKEVK
jgi:hypothetical protein